MSDVALFTPVAAKTAQENMAAFVDFCRNKLMVFGAELPFDSFVWDVTGYIQLKAKKCRVRIFFSSWETVNIPESKPMPEPFVSFAKAYVRYQHGYRPVMDKSMRLSPLRALCAALYEAGKVSPAEIDGLVLNRAAQLLEEKYSKEAAYRLGLQLQLLSEFLDENRLVKIKSNWKSHIKRPSDSQRVGKEFDDRRQEKLPSSEDLDALAAAYRLAKNPEDVIITSIAAIMCATPDRISEVLTLRADCEHQNQLSYGKEVYGLRYWPAKGGDPMIKYVIPAMADIVKDAVARIRRHTESARNLARWYEANPRKLFLPGHLEDLRGLDLTVEQVSEILSGDPGDEVATLSWLRYRKMRPPKMSPKNLRVPFAHLEKVIIDDLPDGFPYLDKGLGLKYSEALCVIHQYAFNQQKRTRQHSLESITHEHMAKGLGMRLELGCSSVFTHLGISGVGGESIQISTHQFRHYLNTLAMHGGLSDLDIAKWSGRKDVRQNRAYDHVSARDKLALIRDAVGDQSKMFGPLGYTPNVPSITRDEFANLKVMNAHTTEFGYCIHDYASSPCQKYLDCLNCNELVCIKGNGAHEANIRRQLNETRDLLAAARQGAEDGAYGANRWVERKRATAPRCRLKFQLVGV